jgi:oligo-1,6-glucosidase
MRIQLIFAFISIQLLCASCDESKQAGNIQTEDSLQKKWWKEAVVYQLYPRSFQDTDGDGVGDLKGITQRLDYLKDLGINAIWLNPIFSSPNDDNGYDISDYRGIMKEMGTMQDFDEMLAGMKQRGIKLILDLVLNHSSDEHEWFKQSRSSRTNPYRNYYHWWPAEKGMPPYRYSLFDEEGNAWRFDSLTNSYYLHYFSRKQPDLNWENPAVREEIYDMMKFWLDKGVSGFRLDAFPFMAKDTSWPALPKEYTTEQIVRYYGKDKKVHTYLNEMYTRVLSKYDAYTVGEGGVIAFKDVMDYVDEDRKEINTLYHDEIPNIWGRDSFDVGTYVVGKNNVVGLKSIVSKWDNKFLNKGWNTVYLTNHDQSRAVSRYGNDAPEFREASAKMLSTFLLTQRATPYLYNGDEIGMSNIRFKNVEQYNDLATRNKYYMALKESKEKAAAWLLNQQELSRDNSRTPMQWDSAGNAGFTTGKPWLTINANKASVNVATSEKDKNSILNYVRKMINLRNANKDVLVYGKYELLDAANPDVYSYTRSDGKTTFLILLNFRKVAGKAALPANYVLGEELINNLQPVQLRDGGILLQPYQSCVIKLK